MQDTRSSSTLELVVNEQQLQNMSRIDLRPTDSNNNINYQANGHQTQSSGSIFSLKTWRSWPTKFREGFSAKMDEARAKSDSKFGFVLEILRVFSGTLIWTICFLFTIIMPVILFFIGLLNLDDCADRPSLPYLIFAMGFVMTASNLFNLALSMDLPILTNHHILTSDVRNIIASITNILFNCVASFLYVISAYMVYNISKTRKSPDNPESHGETIECSASLYEFSFWFITLTLSLTVLIVSLALILYAYNKYRLAIIRGSTPRSHPEAEPSPFTINRM